MYPDKLENIKIIGGTKFSELLFKCDFYLKKMSLGIEEDCKTPFIYPEDLTSLGLLPLHLINSSYLK